MNRVYRLVLFLVLFSLAIPIFAQGAITLVPFADPVFGVQGLIPDGWQKVSPGIYARSSTATDTAVLAVQSAPMTRDALFTALLPQFGLSAIPEPAGETETSTFVWTDYVFDVPLPNGGALTLSVSMAEQEGTTYLVLLQSTPDEAAELTESVFVPARESLRPLVVDEEPVPYVEEEVVFANGDVTLAGTLTLPEGDGPHPAIVLMTGSGPQTRDEIVIVGFPLFKLIADHLTRAGIAVLRYDDRGVGESTGEYPEATIQDFTADAKAAVAYLKTREDINAGEVGVLGHSEGGLYAAMLGGDPESGVAFIVSMAGTAVNGLDVLKVQNQRIYEVSGLSQEATDMQLAFLDELYPLAQARDWESLEQLTYEHVLAQWETLSDEIKEALGGDADAYARQNAEALIAQYANEYFPTMLAYDPTADWSNTTVPVLAIFGALDVQVDADQNAGAIEAALEAAGNEDFEIVVLPDANHLFQSAETGSLEEYGALPPEFTPEFLPTISDWLLERVTVSE